MDPEAQKFFLNQQLMQGMRPTGGMTQGYPQGQFQPQGMYPQMVGNKGQVLPMQGGYPGQMGAGAPQMQSMGGQPGSQMYQQQPGSNPYGQTQMTGQSSNNQSSMGEPTSQMAGMFGQYVGQGPQGQSFPMGYQYPQTASGQQQIQQPGFYGGQMPPGSAPNRDQYVISQMSGMPGQMSGAPQQQYGQRMPNPGQRMQPQQQIRPDSQMYSQMMNPSGMQQQMYSGMMMPNQQNSQQQPNQPYGSRPQMPMTQSPQMQRQQQQQQDNQMIGSFNPMSQNPRAQTPIQPHQQTPSQQQSSNQQQLQQHLFTPGSFQPQPKPQAPQPATQTPQAPKMQMQSQQPAIQAQQQPANTQSFQQKQQEQQQPAQTPQPNQENKQAVIANLNKMAEYYASNQNYQEAIENYLKLTSIDPDNGPAWTALGHCYLLVEDLQKSFNAYQYALYSLEDIKDPQLWYGIGILYEKFESYDHAISALIAVLKMSPNFYQKSEVLFKLGMIQAKKYHLDQAIGSFQASILNDNFPEKRKIDIIIKIGLIYEEKTDIPAAIRQYEAALQYDDANVKAYQHISWAHFKSNNFQAAIENAQLAQSKAPEQPQAETLYIIGRCNFELHDFAQAQENFKSAIAANDQEAVFACSLAIAQYMANNFTDAFDNIIKASVKDPNIREIWYNLGILYERCKQQDEALIAYNKVLDQEQDHADAKARIAKIQSPDYQSEVSVQEVKALKMKFPTFSVQNSLQIFKALASEENQNPDDPNSAKNIQAILNQAEDNNGVAAIMQGNIAGGIGNQIATQPPGSSLPANQMASQGTQNQANAQQVAPPTQGTQPQQQPSTESVAQVSQGNIGQQKPNEVPQVPQGENIQQQPPQINQETVNPVPTQTPMPPMMASHQMMPQQFGSMGAMPNMQQPPLKQGTEGSQKEEAPAQIQNNQGTNGSDIPKKEAEVSRPEEPVNRVEEQKQQTVPREEAKDDPNQAANAAAGANMMGMFKDEKFMQQVMSQLQNMSNPQQRTQGDGGQLQMNPFLAQIMMSGMQGMNVVPGMGMMPVPGMHPGMMNQMPMGMNPGVVPSHQVPVLPNEMQIQAQAQAQAQVQGAQPTQQAVVPQPEVSIENEHVVKQEESVQEKPSEPKEASEASPLKEEVPAQQVQEQEVERAETSAPQAEASAPQPSDFSNAQAVEGVQPEEK